MCAALDFNGCSQYESTVHESYQNSACGPTTVHSILNYYQIHHSINDLYKWLGTTKIGLFKWRFIMRLRRLLKNQFIVAECDIKEALAQLELGYPVAVRFDQYFSWQWRSKKEPLFKYHWVPLIGYEKKEDGLYLMIHDNGGRNRQSQIRTFRYEEQKHLLNFVKIEPKKDRK